MNRVTVFRLLDTERRRKVRSWTLTAAVIRQQLVVMRGTYPA